MKIRDLYSASTTKMAFLLKLHSVCRCFWNVFIFLIIIMKLYIIIYIYSHRNNQSHSCIIGEAFSKMISKLEHYISLEDCDAIASK